MEKFKKGKQMRRERQGALLRLITFAVFLIFLWLVFAAAPAYADTGPKSVIPGPGGMIEGWVYNRQTGSPVSGLNVYLHWEAGGYTGSAGPKKTTASGHFLFGDSDIPGGSGIQPNKGYYICVNGWGYKFAGGWTGDLGSQCEDPKWCQWRGYEVTDGTCYACASINLEPATQVNVPAATLYSNTGYTHDITYATGSSHDLSFTCTVGGIGFMTSNSWTQGISWSIQNKHTAQFGRRYYAASYWDESPDYTTPGVKKSGVSGAVDPYENFRTMDVQEYLTPNLNKPNYGLPTGSTPWSFVIGGNEACSASYTETSSFTWSYGFTGSVGLSFNHFGASIKIDVSVTTTSGRSSAISFCVGPLPPATPHHKFVVYTQGFSFTVYNNNPNDPSNKGGREFHIWDMGVTT